MRATQLTLMELQELAVNGAQKRADKRAAAAALASALTRGGMYTAVDCRPLYTCIPVYPVELYTFCSPSVQGDPHVDLVYRCRKL